MMESTRWVLREVWVGFGFNPANKKYSKRQVGDEHVRGGTKQNAITGLETLAIAVSDNQQIIDILYCSI
jgi:hypothetical protein